MALSKTSMATNIADKLVAAGIVTLANKPLVIAIWEEVCDGIISEITTNAVIATTVTGTANLTTGEVSGTGSGTIL